MGMVQFHTYCDLKLRRGKMYMYVPTGEMCTAKAIKKFYAHKTIEET